ncbi:hypothetical protein CPB83DRAFT_886739 [Crepidotus variabilis]|uniref:Uncharacterized protein n=1 Tax=Crepidotus variabilis TaxID=179855 RepID=A0A9P6E771_9AGAR|nr:hypothetical protein CPB83DRAFT_886739 [Crepidotus variabilis]
MPDVTIRNETNNNLNFAFRLVAPANWVNDLSPGATWTTHLGSVPYTIEVRLNHGNNQFSSEKSWATAADISGGWLAGTASVALGAFSLGGMIASVPGRAAIAAITGPLMRHAIDAGERFAQNADGMVVTVPGVWIPFYNKTYAVRFEEDSGYSVWDLDQNTRLGA